MNTPGVSLMASSGHCNAESKNGVKLWPENLYMYVWSSKNIMRHLKSQNLPPHGGRLRIDMVKGDIYNNIPG